VGLTSARARALWDDPAWRERQLAVIRRTREDPEARARHAKGIRESHKRPVRYVRSAKTAVMSFLTRKGFPEEHKAAVKEVLVLLQKAEDVAARIPKVAP